MSDLIHKKEDIFSNIDFNSFYPDLTEAIKGGVERFWETEVAINLFALNNFKEIRDEYLVKNSNFFISQIRVDNHKPIVIRLDNSFVNIFLGSVLESKVEIKELKKLTQLEVKILNNFCEYLYRQFQDLLIPVKQAKLSNKSEKSANIIFMLSSKENNAGKIMLSVPQDRINMVELKHKSAFSDEYFLNSAAYVKIRAGYTRLTLEELQNLTEDDIVVLENSNINKLTLISGDIQKDFKVEVDKSLMLNMDSDDEESEESQYEVKMEKNLWDDIQIELSAEFSKVKMTIGELKQITRGQVVDLGSVFNNEISLYIEDKKVAKGELLIINDKYAVRLNEVLSNVAKTTPTQAPASKPAATKAEVQGAKQETNKTPQPKDEKAKVKPQVEDEEFDYSDFEN